MPDSGAQQVDALRDTLECPACQYSLRGLLGEVVECPECGERCDIAELIARRWTGPWHQAPGLSTLSTTVLLTLVAIPGLWAVGYSVVYAVLWSKLMPGALVLAFVLLIPVVAGWVGIVRNPHGVLKPRLVLQAHVVVLGYLASMVLLPAVMLSVLAMWGLWGAPVCLLLIAAMAGAFVLSRRMERALGEECIRRALRERTS